MRVIIDSVLEVPDQNTTIWRYIDLAKFMDLIIHKRLFFTNGRNLSDQHEGTIPDAILEAKRLELKKKGLVGRDLAEEMAAFQYLEANSMKDLALFNCWSALQDESYALWKIYLAGQRFGFAIKSTVGRLIDSIEQGKDEYSEDVFIGRVQYSEDLPNDSMHRLTNLTRKMPFYKYENEIRLVILNYPLSEGGRETPYPFNIGRYVKIKTDILIERAYISPFVPDWFFKTIEPVVNKIDTIIQQRLVKSRILDS